MKTEMLYSETTSVNGSTQKDSLSKIWNKHAACSSTTISLSYVLSIYCRAKQANSREKTAKGKELITVILKTKIL